LDWVVEVEAASPVEVEACVVQQVVVEGARELAAVVDCVVADVVDLAGGEKDYGDA
jgi:hypothetical protein